MRVVTFYSFKGGVGRTTAMLNVAYSLAQRGRKVVVADWDLHAPGLSLMDPMSNKWGEKAKRGVLDYLLGLRESDDPEKAKNRVTIAKILHTTKIAVEAQARREGDPEEPAMQGELFCIPAGDLSGGMEKFIQQVKSAQLHEVTTFLNYVAPEEGEKNKRLVFRVFCEELRQTFIPWRMPLSTGAPDYLLVDCRTGITELGELLLGDATDLNVLVYGQDPQNLEGLRLAIGREKCRRPWEMAQNTLLIWSLAPFGQELLKREQRKLKKEIVEYLCITDTLGVREAFPTEFKIPYHPELPLTNIPILHSYAESDLSQLFTKIANTLEKKCHWDDILVEKELSETLPDSKTAADDQILPNSKTAADDQIRQSKLQALLVNESQRKVALLKAHNKLELARELGLGFAAELPPWDFPFKNLSVETLLSLGESADLEQKKLVNLLAYSPSISPTDKKNWLTHFRDKPDEQQNTRLLTYLEDERTKLLTAPAADIWGISQGFLGTLLDWWMVVLEDTEKKRLETHILPPLMDGKGLNEWPISQRPIFNLLIVNFLFNITTVPNNPGNLLIKWLENNKQAVHTIGYELTIQYCRSFQDDPPSPSVKNYAWKCAGYFASKQADNCTEKAVKRPWLEKSIEGYETAISAHPKIDTFSDLGSTLISMGHIAPTEEKSIWFKRSLEQIQKARQLAPENAGLRFNHACALSLLGKKEESLAELRIFLEKEPSRLDEIIKDKDFDPMRSWKPFQELLGLT